MSEQETSRSESVRPSATSRRRFLGHAAAAAASTSLLSSVAGRAAEKASPAAKPAQRKIKVGCVGCGGRGAWIASLFHKHGGYEVHALADYFQTPLDACGDALGVDKKRRFTGLSGYKKVLESGGEALVIEDIPYFYAEQAQAAVDAGCHIYMAKPVATDVPGCLSIEATGKRATQKNLVFHVDYQMRTDPVNIEVVKRIWDGGMGKVLAVTTYGGAGGALGHDKPREKTIENRMQHLIWVGDIVLGCDKIGNFDIHSIDAALWVIRQRPISCVGVARIFRPNPVADAHDLYFLTYECADGLVWNHQSFFIPDHGKALVCNVNGEKASAQISYWGKSFLRGGPKHYGGGEVVNLYQEGAVRNIAAFHRLISEGRADNPTVQSAVDGTLITILGREAGHRGIRLTMDQLIKENKKLPVNLSGLKV